MLMLTRHTGNLEAGLGEDVRASLTVEWGGEGSERPVLVPGRQHRQTVYLALGSSV